MTVAFSHEPVMLQAVVDAIAPTDGEVYVDCTLGGGGHTEALLEAADCRVIGLDRDPAALAAASERLARFGDRFTPVHARFSELADVLAEQGLSHVHGILADLGVSSHQLDTAERGFSFQRSGPIDMRMDPTAPVSAADLVNTWSADDLADVIKRYGEERHARRVARAIVEGRPWDDTLALAEAVARIVGRRGRSRSRIHPATRTFQGLRIAVNAELSELEALLPAAVHLLHPEGRLAILTFHSLEDRLVKRFFARASGRTLPRDPYGDPVGSVTLRVAASLPSPPEDPNPRARSARLRSATRLPWNES